MAVNRSQREVIAHRRAVVAQMRLRNMTIDEITQALRAQRIVNPRSDRPWSRATVYKDLQALDDDWRERAADDIDSLRARQLAELRQARATAWRTNNLSEVRHLLKLEIDLLGTAAPERSLVIGAHIDVSTLSDEELRAIIEG